MLKSLIKHLVPVIGLLAVPTAFTQTGYYPLPPNTYAQGDVDFRGQSALKVGNLATNTNVVNDPPINPKDYGAIGDGSSHTITQIDITNHIGGNPAYWQWHGKACRRVTDGVVTSGSSTVTSATANFTSADLGLPIRGTGIPIGAVIKTRNSSTSITFTTTFGNATASNSNVTLDIGHYRAGDEWDYVGMQEALFIAYYGQGGTGLVPNWTNNFRYNRPISIPAGNYQINQPVMLYCTTGARIYGTGRTSTILNATSPNTATTIWCDGVLYSTFEGITISCSGGVSSLHSVWLHDSQGQLTQMAGKTTASHACTFKDMYFAGQGRTPILFELNPSLGGNGDMFNFISCAFDFPSPGGQGYTQWGQNSLNNSFYTCDFLTCDFGIKVIGGTVSVYNATFEPDTYSQIKYNGYNVVLGTEDNASSRVCYSRTEGPKQIKCGSGPLHYIENHVAGNATASVPAWTARTAKSLGNMICGTLLKGVGRIYACVQAGNTGTTEPSWNPGLPEPNASRGYGYAYNASMTAGSNIVTLANSAETSFGSGQVGAYMQVFGAGPGGTDLVSTIAGFTNLTHVTLADNASTTVSNVRINYGFPITDGTVKWIMVDYTEADFSSPLGVSMVVDGNQFWYGRIMLGATTLFTNNSYARTDAFSNNRINMWAGAGGVDGGSGAEFHGNWCSLNQGPTGSAWTPSANALNSVFQTLSNPRTRGWRNIFGLWNDTPVFFMAGKSGSPWTEVGFMRGDGTTQPLGDYAYSGTTTSGSPTVTFTGTPNFTTSDIGFRVATANYLPFPDPNIPPDTKIKSINSSTSFEMTKNALTNATFAIAIWGRDSAARNQHLYHDIIHVEGTLGKRVATGTDAKGDDLVFQAGLGTGAGSGGSIRFYTQPAGSTGSTVPDSVQAMSIWNTQRVDFKKACRIAPTTFANAIASPLEGDMMYFTDSNTSTYGATIAGGGANHVLGVYNGTNWIVH
jgi:hypothetical protein